MIMRTQIPDSAFRMKLIQLGLEFDDNNCILTSELQKIARLDLSRSEIKSIEGIARFENLVFLNCQNNLIENLDLSENLILEKLNCSLNPLGKIDLSRNILLTELYCNYNILADLDVSNNINLSYLSCNTNQLKKLDLSNNILLENFFCSTNHIKLLDLSQNAKLEEVRCDHNHLTQLNLGVNLNLKFLSCNNNHLEKLDISNNPNLQSLLCYRNESLEIISNENINLVNFIYKPKERDQNAEQYEDLTFQNPKWEIWVSPTLFTIKSLKGPFKSKSGNDFYKIQLENTDNKHLFERVLFSEGWSELSVGSILEAKLAKYNNKEFVVVEGEHIDVAFRLMKN